MLKNTSPAALALLLGLAGCGGHGGGATANQVRPVDEAAPVAVETAVAEPRDVPRTLVLTGSLVADRQSDVTPVVGGRVIEVLVERGAVVEEGAPLVRIRDVDFRLQAQLASANLAQARARVGHDGANAPSPDQMPDVLAAFADRELARATYERTQRLAATGAAAPAEVDRAYAASMASNERYTATLNGARSSVAALQSARVQLQQAQTAMRESIVRAPFAGEIAERYVDVGEYVAPASRIVSLVRTNPLRMEVQVPQDSLRFVQRGQQVDVQTDAFPDRHFAGVVRYVSAAVRADTRGLIVEAEVPNDDGALRPGLFASARIDLGELVTVAVVPRTAVLDQAGVQRVFVIRDNVVEEHVVTVMDRRDDSVLISDGLAPSSVVAISALDALADGSRVTATAAAPAPVPTPAQPVPAAAPATP